MADSNNIGAVYASKGEYDKALEHYQKALAIRLKQLGPEHPSVAISRNNIGGVHDNKGEYDKAPSHQKAPAIYLKQPGPDILRPPATTTSGRCTLARASMLALEPPEITGDPAQTTGAGASLWPSQQHGLCSKSRRT